MILTITKEPCVLDAPPRRIDPIPLTEQERALFCSIAGLEDTQGCEVREVEGTESPFYEGNGSYFADRFGTHWIPPTHRVRVGEIWLNQWRWARALDLPYRIVAPEKNGWNRDRHWSYHANMGDAQRAQTDYEIGEENKTGKHFFRIEHKNCFGKWMEIEG